VHCGAAVHGCLQVFPQPQPRPTPQLCFFHDIYETTVEMIKISGAPVTTDIIAIGIFCSAQFRGIKLPEESNAVDKERPGK
jgi:hypothetical protein